MKADTHQKAGVPASVCYSSVSLRGESTRRMGVRHGACLECRDLSLIGSVYPRSLLRLFSRRVAKRDKLVCTGSGAERGRDPESRFLVMREKDVVLGSAPGSRTIMQRGTGDCTMPEGAQTGMQELAYLGVLFIDTRN